MCDVADDPSQHDVERKQDRVVSYADIALMRKLKEKADDANRGRAMLDLAWYFKVDGWTQDEAIYMAQALELVERILA